MTKQTDFTKIFGQMPNMMDNKALEDGFKRMADINEQMTGVAADAAAKTTEIMAGSATETFDNVRKLSTARATPTDYGQAFSDFAQAQMQLAQRATEAFADVAKDSGGKFAGMASVATDTATKTASKAAAK
ncbi:MAG: hypothetical protein CML50_12920 [Rhodobacteraceae bacterium]|jgi:uncharacterized protein YoxC|uniref:Granule-associated protein n=1 Tax=Salipiger profundus TaxID=1229727 RepID=A0A1U7D7Q9_9RHOB